MFQKFLQDYKSFVSTFYFPRSSRKSCGVDRENEIVNNVLYLIYTASSARFIADDDDKGTTIHVLHKEQDTRIEAYELVNFICRCHKPVRQSDSGFRRPYGCLESISRERTWRTDARPENDNPETETFTPGVVTEPLGNLGLFKMDDLRAPSWKMNNFRGPRSSPFLFSLPSSTLSPSFGQIAKFSHLQLSTSELSRRFFFETEEFFFPIIFVEFLVSFFSFLFFFFLKILRLLVAEESFRLGDFLLYFSFY